MKEPKESEWTRSENKKVELKGKDSQLNTEITQDKTRSREQKTVENRNREEKNTSKRKWNEDTGNYRRHKDREMT